MKDYNLESRKYILAGVVIAVLAIYVARLFSIQLGNEDYQTIAESNTYYRKTVYPARGHMYDRNGKLVVYNQPSYDVTFIPRETKDVNVEELCDALNMTTEEYKERMKKVKNTRLNPGYSTYTEQVFLTQLPEEDFARFQENLFRFPGLFLRKRSIRQYNYNAAGVLLGDIGEVSKSKIEFSLGNGCLME